MKQCPVCKSLGNIFDRINERYKIDKKGCHVWNSYLSKDGYAVINYRGKRLRVARFLLERKIGRKIRDMKRVMFHFVIIENV